MVRQLRKLTKGKYMTTTKKPGAPRGNTNGKKSGPKLDQTYFIYCTSDQKARWPKDKNIARKLLDEAFSE